jgi:hypothetical protein
MSSLNWINAALSIKCANVLISQCANSSSSGSSYKCEVHAEASPKPVFH